MRKNIRVTNMTLSPESADYLAKRVASIEKRITGDADAAIADIEVGRTTGHHHTGDVFRAEINILIGGRHFRSASEKSDLHAAIDDAKDQMERELTADKGKRITLARRGAAFIKRFMKGNSRSGT